MDTSRWGLPVRRVERRTGAAIDPSTWPATVPAVAQVLREGLDLGPVTVLVGENGAGKSTLVEGLAGASGLDPGGGTRNTRGISGAGSDPLEPALQVVRGPGAARWGFFLRAETMHAVFAGIGGPRDPDFTAMSHGESFLALLTSRRFNGGGLYLLDEPESALSFSASLALVGVLHDLVADGTAQVVVATHSPVVAALPGATVLQVDQDGLHETTWADLALVDPWRRFLDAPDRYLRHIAD